MSDDQFPGPERVLVICAHPDDVDFGASATVARWVKAGTAVTYCIVTQGQAGSSDPTASPESIAALRMSEQLDAASEVGVTDVQFLDHLDGAVVADLSLRRDLTRVIRAVRPQLVVTQSPERNLDFVYASHPDHLATGDAAMAAVYPDARNPHAFRELLDDEGLEPWAVDDVWLMAARADVPPESRVVVDVTETFDRKVAALRAHHSQNDRWEELPDMMAEWGRATASRGGLPEGRLAEMFRRIDTR